MYLMKLQALLETISGAVSYVRDPTMTAELLKCNDVDAIEIHTTGMYVLLSLLVELPLTFLHFILHLI
jgi:hypothetical protein